MEIIENKNDSRIASLIGYVKERGMFRGIRRYSYLNYDIDADTELIEALGKARTSKFRIDPDNRFAYRNFIRWARGDRQMQSINPETHSPVRGDINRGIYLAGGTGTGKSWCMHLMLAYCRATGFKIKFGSDEDSNITWVDARADAVCQSYAETGNLAKYKTCNILCLQDFGSEPLETLFMGNRLNVLRNILEYRGDRSDCITLITSNIPVNHALITERYGARVASRLAEMCNYIEIRGLDRRTI